MANIFGALSVPGLEGMAVEDAAQAAADRQRAAVLGPERAAALGAAQQRYMAGAPGRGAAEWGRLGGALYNAGRRIATLPASLAAADQAQRFPQLGDTVSDSPIDPAALSGELALNVMGGGLSFGRAPAGSVGVFAGRAAKTADHAALEQAREMAKAGALPADIHAETGWFQGPDKHWRFEIDDSKATMSTAHGPGATVGSQLDHPELFEAYPDLKNIGMLWGSPPKSGHYEPPAYRGGPEKISVSTAGDNQRGIMLHEVQHAIQEREGFAKGGSPYEFTNQEGAQHARNALALRREMGALPNAAEITPTEAVGVIRKQYQDIGAPEWMHPQEAIDLALDPGWSNDYLMRQVQLYGLDKRTSPYTGREIYKRLSGEVEARNVENRKDWNAERRADVPPAYSQDVPDADQIVRFNTAPGQLKASEKPPFGSLAPHQEKP